MRTLYSLAVYLLALLVLLHLLLRGLRNPAYLKRWSERFGRLPRPVAHGGIAVHAVSVGEVNAAAPLVRELAARYPGRQITFTCFTPTGSERVSALFGETVNHLYAPLDLPGAVSRFLDAVEPALLIVMETEIWPNFFEQAARRGIPIMLANARISDHSIGRYRRLRPLTRAALERVSRIGAQTELDAERFRAIGAPAERVEVTGNLKFDLRLPAGLAERGQALRSGWGAQRPVIVAGSTHEGDEDPVLQAFTGLLAEHPDALLVLVPRHPERFEKAVLRARAHGLGVAVFSAGPCPASAQCFVVDVMGELLKFYAACDVAFVGGSFDRTGGHNVLEPAALGRPVLVGPHTFNFEEITAQLLALGGGQRVADARELQQALASLLDHAAARQRMGEAGRALVTSRQGALSRTLQMAAELLAHSSN